ncbi:hypothetical protein BQ8482_150052 [Mesorhizobium delmotii]|uniref:Uncharacterized protein n=1 Tax=Mesorhizobium delmotii TaxID=1631247 RepID=A0A2P9AH65_9HYPH|nr:hypothetical protein BQ8482_150052 [Mesorhizobium delmotii]
MTVEGATAQRGAPLIYDDDKLAIGAKAVIELAEISGKVFRDHRLRIRGSWNGPVAPKVSGQR